MSGLEVENLQNIVWFIKNQEIFPFRNLTLEFKLSEKELRALDEQLFMITNPLNTRDINTKLIYRDEINVTIEEMNFRFILDKKESSTKV